MLLLVHSLPMLEFETGVKHTDQRDISGKIMKNLPALFLSRDGNN